MLRGGWGESRVLSARGESERFSGCLSGFAFVCASRRGDGVWGPAVRRRKRRPRPCGEESAVGDKNFSRSDWGHRCDRRNVAVATFRPRAADWSLRWQSAELGSVTQAHTVWLSGGFLCLEIAGRDWDFGFLRLTRRRTELRSSSSWRRKLGFCTMGRRPVRRNGAAGVSRDASAGLTSKKNSRFRTSLRGVWSSTLQNTAWGFITLEQENLSADRSRDNHHDSRCASPAALRRPSSDCISKSDL